ncbi:MAG: hypothetical protein KatS3mg111_0872 [Pirellulaceae bacterium]|nr:MAG: hypothetical protein KatS3mg111_0872 [Pirellulaceae bacterium]
MLKKLSHRQPCAWLILSVLLLCGGRATAGDPACCMCGKRVCVLEVTPAKEEITCFDVEAKEMCIPGIKLPWECKRRCGRVRTICVLKEVKEERSVCKYDWSVRVICTSCCRQHGLPHGGHCAEKHQSPRVPFEYYSAEPPSASSLPAVDAMHRLQAVDALPENAVPASNAVRPVSQTTGPIRPASGVILP